MIETLPDFPDNVVALACRDHVTRQDYETVLLPTVETALKGHGKVRICYQIGADFAGIEPEAVWQDFKVGVEHLSRWERIAVVTDIDWIRFAMQAFGFMIPGEVKMLPTSEMPSARAWIVAALPRRSRRLDGLGQLADRARRAQCQSDATA